MKEICGKLEIIKTESENALIIGGYKVTFGPKIVIYPSFAPTITELKYKLSQMRKGIKISIPKIEDFLFHDIINNNKETKINNV